MSPYWHQHSELLLRMGKKELPMHMTLWMRISRTEIRQSPHILYDLYVIFEPRKLSSSCQGLSTKDHKRTFFEPGNLLTSGSWWWFPSSNKCLPQLTDLCVQTMDQTAYTLHAVRKMFQREGWRTRLHSHCSPAFWLHMTTRYRTFPSLIFLTYKTELITVEAAGKTWIK